MGPKKPNDIEFNLYSNSLPGEFGKAWKVACIQDPTIISKSLWKKKNLNILGPIFSFNSSTAKCVQTRFVTVFGLKLISSINPSASWSSYPMIGA